MMTHTSIRARRIALGLTQAALAQRAGLARATLGRFERHGTDIGLKSFSRLLGVLGLVMKIDAANEVIVNSKTDYKNSTRLFAYGEVAFEF